MRSEVKKMLETAENGELIAYITKDQSVAMDELQLWMLCIPGPGAHSLGGH